MIGAKHVGVLKAMGMLSDIEDALLPTMVTTTDDGDQLMPIGDNWVDTEIEVTLDSGCCEHVMDIADAPGYCAFITESSGSRRKQNFIVGNGEKVPNEGQVTLNMFADDTKAIRSVFQIAEVTRPLMSVGRICDQGMLCTFDESKALITDKDNNEVCRFDRRGGLYVATMKLKSPEHFARQEK